jgi:hypothetical protein
MNIEIHALVEVELLFMLLAAHVFADFVFQTDIMAKLKNRHNKPEWLPQGQKYVPCWPYWLTAHAFVHATLVFYVTHSFACALVELIAHWCIDYAKCEGRTNPHQDQLLHVICKLLYWIVI